MFWRAGGGNIISNSLSKLIASFALTVTAWQQPLRQANTLLRVSNLLHRRHTIATAAGPITFVSTHPQAMGYATSLLTREPETIAWLDAIGPNDVLWDIGANVGAYSLYAARRGIRVWAFEPAPASFAALSENIRLNGFDSLISALPIALGRETCLGWLEMTGTNAGSVAHSFEAGTTDRARIFRQSTIGYSIDEVCRTFGVPAPNFIKLDVDGIEADILHGARDTLAANGFKSLLVEEEVAETENGKRIVEIVTAAGLRRGRTPRPDGFGTQNVIYTRV